MLDVYQQFSSVKEKPPLIVLLVRLSVDVTRIA